MDAATEAAIGAGDNVFAADDLRVAHDAVGDDLRMLDDIGGMTDDAGNEQLSVRQLDVLPHAPFVLVADVTRFDRIGTGIDAKHQVDDVVERNVGGVRTVPAAPADVEADAVCRAGHAARD